MGKTSSTTPRRRSPVKKAEPASEASVSEPRITAAAVYGPPPYGLWSDRNNNWLHFGGQLWHTDRVDLARAQLRVQGGGHDWRIRSIAAWNAALPGEDPLDG